MAWAAIEPVDPPMIAIGCDKSEHHLVQAIPGCNYSKTDHIWRVPLTWPGYVCFRTAWEGTPIVIHPKLLGYGEGMWLRVSEMMADRLKIDADPEYLSLIERAEADNTMVLRPDQRGGVAWLVKYGRAGIEDPTGNGKTPVIIRALQVQQLLTGGALPALYIGNGSALFAIRDKFAQWAPELKVRVVTGTAKTRDAALGEGADVYLIAWDNVRLHTRLAPYGSERLVRCPDCGGQDPRVKGGRCEAHEKELNRIRFGTVIADEAHKLRNPKSKWTRAVWWLAHHCEFFWPLTGTLVADTVADPWGVMHAMDPKGWPSRSRYLDMFAIKDYNWHGGAEILGIRPDHAYALHTIIQPYWRRIPKEIARPFQPPRLEPEFRYPEMSPKQQAAYRQLVKDALADLEGYSVVTDNALAKYNRLCQVASSMIEQHDAEDRQGFTQDAYHLVLPSNKVDDLLEFCEDTDGQIVVAAISPSLIELAEKKLHAAGITSAKIVGGMSHEAQYTAQQWFTQGQVRVMFINAAGAESIDLQTASVIYFMEPDTSFLQREQKIGRVDRFGQQFAVRQVYAISRGTVDERRYKLGCDKAERHDQVARDVDLMRWILTGEAMNWAAG
jgi:SNF2 family DNA or RNA helicase